MKISGLVITFNEEKNIGKCIDALLKVCEEVIIVDSFSKDRTVEIAQKKVLRLFNKLFWEMGRKEHMVYRTVKMTGF